MTLKQNEGHQICNENVDPEQGSNHAKFERSHYDSVQEKGNIQVFSKREIYQLSPLNMCENENMVVYS